VVIECVVIKDRVPEREIEIELKYLNIWEVWNGDVKESGSTKGVNKQGIVTTNMLCILSKSSFTFFLKIKVLKPKKLM
jgi:D-hexose-6-phosphate mutarotase